jgi:hypothetical protein
MARLASSRNQNHRLQKPNMDSEEQDTKPASDAQAGWNCARLLAIIRTVSAHGAGLEERLSAFDPTALRTEDAAAMTAADLDAVVSEIHALQDAVDIMAFLVDRLRGRKATLVVTAEELRTEATRALAQGSADLASVRFAAGMLDDAEGFPALADAIAVDPSVASQWTEITVLDLLTVFHASDPMHARRVCLTALVHPDAPMSSLDLEAMRRLADALRSADG